MTPRGTIRRRSDAPAVVFQIDNLAASCRAGVARDLRSRGPEGTRHSRLLLRGRGRATGSDGQVAAWASGCRGNQSRVDGGSCVRCRGSRRAAAQPGAHRLVEQHAVRWRSAAFGTWWPTRGRESLRLPGDWRTGDASVRRAQRAGRSESGDALGSMSAARGSRGPRGESPRKRDACIATISVVSRV